MNPRTGCGSRSSPTGRERGASRRTPPSCWPTQHKHNSRQHLAQENNDGAPDLARLCHAGLKIVHATPHEVAHDYFSAARLEI